MRIDSGMSYIRSVDVERHHSKAEIASINEGTNQIRHMIIASRLFP